jgi:glycosidase
LLAGESSYGKSNEYLSGVRMSEEEKSDGVRLLKTAYTILATLPGLPTIFYGDEAGLEGYGDPFNRMPYPWGKENDDLLSHYRAVGALRRSNNVYKDGEFELHLLNDNILAFSRSKNGVRYVTLVNNTSSPLRLIDKDKLNIILGEKDIIPAKSAVVIKTKTNRIQFIKI